VEHLRGSPTLGRSQTVITTSERSGQQRFAWSNRAATCGDAVAIGIFGTGVTQKFAQIFFRDDKDLRGKRSKDPENAYVTGIFGGP
jgi:hypothetical protein